MVDTEVTTTTKDNNTQDVGKDNETKTESEKPKVPFFRKRNGAAAKANARKRRQQENSDDEHDNDDNEGSAVIKAEKKNGKSALLQGTGGFKRKKSAAQAEQEEGEQDSDDDEYSQQKHLSKDAISVRHGDRNRHVNRTPSPDPETSTDKSKSKSSSAAAAAATSKSDGLYHGTANYGSQLPSGSSRYGPIKGPANVRTITLMDYQPDVCKDYKETGFCGFGDTCKFLHDRGDYMHGWQMENNYLSNPIQSTEPANAKSSKEEEEEDLPFACLICRQPFTDPVETKCGHFFCSACAIKRYAKTPKCFACGTPTGGIFNAAKKIIEMQKKIDQAQQAETGGLGDAEESSELTGIEGLAEEPEP